MSQQGYVDGVAVRTNYKQPTFTPKRTGWDKAGDVAYGTGYVVGVANTQGKGNYHSLMTIPLGQHAERAYNVERFSFNVENTQFLSYCKVTAYCIRN